MTPMNDGENQIPGLCSGADGSMVAQTVRKLTALSLAAKDGDYLGAEADLLKTFGVSRPTLRQAAKVVQSDRLLDVRRGINGGFFAGRPQIRHAMQAPAMWLRLQNATLAQMSRASTLIFPVAAAEAAACDDAVLFAELQAFRAGIDRRANESARETLDAETRFADLIARMSGDPVLHD